MSCVVAMKVSPVSPSESQKVFRVRSLTDCEMRKVQDQEKSAVEDKGGVVMTDKSTRIKARSGPGLAAGVWGQVAGLSRERVSG